jgi:hypothetical protein
MKSRRRYQKNHSGASDEIIELQPPTIAVTNKKKRAVANNPKKRKRDESLSSKIQRVFGEQQQQ